MLLPQERLFGFIADVIEHPDDDVPKLILADYLEDHNDPRGALLRIVPAVRRCPLPTEIAPSFYPWLLQAGLRYHGSRLSERFCENKETYLAEYGLDPRDSCQLRLPQWGLAQGVYGYRGRVPNLIGIGMLLNVMDRLLRGYTTHKGAWFHVPSPQSNERKATDEAWAEASNFITRALLYSAYLLDLPQRDDVRLNTEWRELRRHSPEWHNIKAKYRRHELLSPEEKSKWRHANRTEDLLLRRRCGKRFSPKYSSRAVFANLVASELFPRTSLNVTPGGSYNIAACAFTRVLWQLRGQHGHNHIWATHQLHELENSLRADITPVLPTPEFLKKSRRSLNQDELQHGVKLASRWSVYLAMFNSADLHGNVVPSERAILQHLAGVKKENRRVQQETRRKELAAFLDNQDPTGEKKAAMAQALQNMDKLLDTKEKT